VDWILATNLAVGALLAMLGGMATQLVVRWVSRRDAKQALITALTAEILCARESLSASLSGFRDSLRASNPPTPTTFSTPTIIYYANAGRLGDLRDYDLIEHIVDVYSSINDLCNESLRYQGIANSAVELSQLNAIHMDATVTHVKAIKLHTRLSKLSSGGDRSPMLLDIEAESKELSERYHSQIEAGNIHEILEHEWSDA
jgi:hypothetical protein